MIDWGPPQCSESYRTPIPILGLGCRRSEPDESPGRFRVDLGLVKWPDDPPAVVVAGGYSLRNALGEWLGIDSWKRTPAAPFFDARGTVVLHGPGGRKALPVRVIRAGENWNVETDYETEIAWPAFSAAVGTGAEGTLEVELVAADLRINASYALSSRTAEALLWLRGCERHNAE